MSRFLAVLIVLCFMSCNNKEVKIKKMPIKSEKVVIAHRGASGYLPEHTLPAKAMAYGMNVDFIEHHQQKELIFFSHQRQRHQCCFRHLWF